MTSWVFGAGSFLGIAVPGYSVSLLGVLLVTDVVWCLLGPHLLHARSALGYRCGLVSPGDRFSGIVENCGLGAGDFSHCLCPYSGCQLFSQCASGLLQTGASLDLAAGLRLMGIGDVCVGSQLPKCHMSPFACYPCPSVPVGLYAVI